MTQSHSAQLLHSLDAAIAAQARWAQDPTLRVKLDAMAAQMIALYQAGNKVFACGNGGSLCQAMHFAEELTGRYESDRPPLPAIALTDPSHISCVANDYGYEAVFSRALQALSVEGDGVLLLSTSGNSANLIAAAHAAKARGVSIFALLGRDGGQLAALSDHVVIIPDLSSAMIQNAHTVIIHLLIEAIETAMYPSLCASKQATVPA